MIRCPKSPFPDQVAAGAWRFAWALVVAVIAPCAYGQATVWTASVESRWGASGVGSAYVAPGVVYTTGTRWGLFGLNLLPWLTRVDAAGRVTIVQASDDAKPLEGPPGVPQDIPTRIVAGSDDVYVLGRLQLCNIGPIPPAGCAPQYHWLERHTPAAGRAWRALPEASTALAADRDGVYVAGRPGEARAQKLDRSGTVLWTRTLADAGGDGFNDVALVPGGGIVAAGAAAAGPLLQRFDAAGNALWPISLIAGLGTDVRLLRVVVDRAGDVYAAGLRTNAGRPADIVIVKVGAAGAVQWIRARAGVVPVRNPQTDPQVHALALDSRGRVIVSGLATTPLDHVAWTAAYDAAGTLQWSDEYAPSADAFAAASALGVDARDHVYVGGYHFAANATVTNGFVRKLAPDGRSMWTVLPAAVITDLTIGAGGEVFALANGAGGSGVDLLRIDPGAAQGAAPPTLQLVVPASPLLAGQPIMLVVLLRGAVAPTGIAAFRVNGAVVCSAVALQMVDATTARAECLLAQGVPIGTTTVEVVYAGDMNFGAASTSAGVSAAAASARDIPALSPLGLALLVALTALVGARLLATRERRSDER